MVRAILIDPVFVVGGGTAYLRQVQRTGTFPRIKTALTTTASGDDPGPELVSEWEVFENAILMQRNGVDDLELKGPGSPDNPFSDDAEALFLASRQSK